MIAKVIQASAVAEQYIKEIKHRLNPNNPPKLVGFLANDDPSALKYAEWTARTCSDTGIVFDLVKCTRNDLEERIVEANTDPSIHGILVYYPVFGGSNDQYLCNTVSVEKDVEGLCHRYLFNMYHNRRYLDAEETKKCIIPCTPLAIVKILEFIGVYNHVLQFGNRLYGKVITIVNRSEVVGRPLAAMLANDGAKVFSFDENGVLEFHRGQGLKLQRHETFDSHVSLETALQQSDVVITGVPSDTFKLDVDLLKEGVVAVNFSSFKNIPPEIKSKASIFVPSVGKVTIAMLERNLLRLHEYQSRQ